LPIAKDVQMRSKQRIHILGYPVGLPLSVTEGVVSHPKQVFDDQLFLQTDAAINPGNSGGPILDDQWRIVAVTTCKLTQSEAVGFGIPADDVAQFVDEFRKQTESFGLQCPACEELISKDVRDCPNCGANFDHVEDLHEFFSPPDAEPLKAFVEGSLQHAGIDPVLARDGDRVWSFRAGNSTIRAWCCCSEHLNLTSVVAEVGQSQFEPLFRYMLDEQHAPYSYDLRGKSVRLVHVLHMADAFTPQVHEEHRERLAAFINKVAGEAPKLMKEFGCNNAPEEQALVE
jgi:serine protease Do